MYATSGWVGIQLLHEGPMNKFGLTLLLVFVVALVCFSTWHLFAGNLMASFSTFPFLLITYLFVLKLRRAE